VAAKKAVSLIVEAKYFTLPNALAFKSIVETSDATPQVVEYEFGDRFCVILNSLINCPEKKQKATE